MSHSVETHLNLTLATYETAIRTLIPFYDEMQTIGISLIRNLAKHNPHIIDLGCGTGRFAQTVLNAIPDATVTLVDIDPKSLSAARQRLASEPKRTQFLEANFHSPLPKAEVVVASLSLHHIPTIEEKTKVYASILRSLKNGGLFLGVDCALTSDSTLRKLAFEDWASFMATHGISREQAHQKFSDWAKEDHYLPLQDELNALQAAGFSRPECFWRRGPVAVFGALKSVI